MKLQELTFGTPCNFMELITHPCTSHVYFLTLAFELQCQCFFTSLHEKLDLQKFTRCKYDAKKCKLRVNQKQRW